SLIKQVLRAYIFCGACGNNRTNRGGFQFAAARLPWFNRYGGFFCYLLVFTVTAQEVFDEPSVQCSVVPGNMTCLFQPFPAIELLQRYRFF
ncbi:hypothetical protein, partial [Escherichia coli]|uniref:hypothetical protein n=1 Tax=Escherichia coli TaxID=562 RepID=UPI0021B314D0